MSLKIMLNVSSCRGQSDVVQNGNGLSIVQDQSDIEKIEVPLEASTDLSSLVKSVTEAKEKVNKVLTKYVEQRKASKEGGGGGGGAAKATDGEEAEQNYMEDDGDSDQDEEEDQQPKKKTKCQA